MDFETHLFNHTAKLFLGQEVDLENLKVMLLDNTAVFDATDTTLVEVAGVANAKEVDGNGWPTGGALIENVIVSIATIDDARLDADEVRERATGGPIGPAWAAVVFVADGADNPPLIYIDFNEALTAGTGVDFLIPCNPIIYGIYTPPT